MTAHFVAPLQIEVMWAPNGDDLLTRDGRQLFRVIKDFIYWSDVVNEFIVVKAGFITDFGSVPRIPLLFDMLGDITCEPYVIHDDVYMHQKYARDICDKILAEALTVKHIAQWKIDAIYEGVRIGGGAHFGPDAPPDPTYVDNPVPV